jgi:hypothetical protein
MNGNRTRLGRRRGLAAARSFAFDLRVTVDLSVSGLDWSDESAFRATVAELYHVARRIRA